MKIPTQINDRFRYGLLFVYLMVIIIGISISSHYQRKEMAHFINAKYCHPAVGKFKIKRLFKKN